MSSTSLMTLLHHSWTKLNRPRVSVEELELRQARCSFCCFMLSHSQNSRDWWCCQSAMRDTPTRAHTTPWTTATNGPQAGRVTFAPPAIGLPIWSFLICLWELRVASHPFKHGPFLGLGVSQWPGKDGRLDPSVKQDLEFYSKSP